MNNDASSSSSRTSSTQDELPSGSAADDSHGVKTRKRLQSKKRAACLDHLVLNLDIMIYLQISILYYMELIAPPGFLRPSPADLLQPVRAHSSRSSDSAMDLPDAQISHPPSISRHHETVHPPLLRFTSVVYRRASLG